MMLMTDEELGDYFARQVLGRMARELIVVARSSDPSRRVAPAGSKNTPSRYPSRKMGWTVSLESNEEHTYALLLEYNEDVLEYWDQPFRLAFPAQAANGGMRRVSYHPDFLVLYRDRVEIVQVKPLEEWKKLAKANPLRWVADEHETCDLAANAYLSSIGLKHVAVTDGVFNRVLAENCALLMHTARHADPSQLPTLAARASALLSANGPMRSYDLMRLLGETGATSIVLMVYHRLIETDLSIYRLAKPESCWVSLDLESLRRHMAATSALQAHRVDPISQLTSSEAIATYDRLRAIKGDISPSCSGRTFRRWRHSLKQAGNDVHALVPRTRLKGNRNPRLLPYDKKVIDRSLQTTYLSPTSPSVYGAYRHYLVDHANALAQKELPPTSRPVSYSTYRASALRLDREGAARARGGKRAAYAAAAPTPNDVRHLEPQRAFERAHVDHYKCDIHALLRGQDDERIPRRPWLTLLRDERSGAALAVSISLLDPSRRSCMSVLRDCVRRHGRLPESIIADNGKEFGSEYFELFLARYGVAKVSRPPGAPRYGGCVESAFRSFKEFLRNFPGNTHNDAKGRSASKSHRGDELASLDLHLIHHVANEYFFDLFNEHPVSAALDSPGRILRESLEAFPHSGIPVQFDPTFLAHSALPLPKKLLLDPGRGIRHLGRWFYSPDLPRQQVRLEVFEEPWDSNKLYALVDGRLITCIHGASTALNAMPDADRAIESVLFLECAGYRGRLAAKKAKATAEAARRIIRSIEALPKPPESPAKAGSEIPPRRRGLRPFKAGDSS